MKSYKVARLACWAISFVLGVYWIAPPRAAAEEPFQKVVLENGLTLLLAPSEAHPVISLSMYVTTGGRTEDEYFQGSLHYIEHLVYKGGTPNLEPTQFRKKMALLGREAGGWTWDDEINFGFEVPKENFPEALGIFREALLDLQFEEQWFEDEKKVVLQEMERGLERPGEMLFKAWDEMAFTVHPYGRDVIGTEKAINELEMHRTEAYYRERFTPNHTILSIAGDFDVNQMVRWIEKEWGDRKPGPASFELGLSEEEQTGPRWREEYVPQATNAILLTGVVGPPGDHEDVPALVLLGALLENGSFGLPQYLEEQEKWVVELSAFQYTMRDYSTFLVNARMDAAKAKAVRDFVNRFLLEFDASAVPAEIFEEARRGLLFSEARQRETFANVASQNGFEVSRLGEEGARRYLDRIARLTPAEVQAAKERWIRARKLVTATVFPQDFDPADFVDRVVEAKTPQLGELPDLDVAGGLRPPREKKLDFRRTEKVEGVSVYEYENGLRLVVRPSDASPLFAVSGRVLGGQWVEPEGQAGINRMTAELGMRRTRRWDREEFMRLLGALSLDASAHISTGGRSNTSRNVHYRDAGAHHVEGLVDQWRESLAILKETLFFPDFDAGEVEKVREDLLTEIRTLPENNLEFIKQEFYLRAFEGHPYGRPTVGTEESIGAITPGDLARFHDANWTPDRTVVSVVGDVDADEVAQWIATRWADLPARRGGALKRVALPRWKPDRDLQVLDLGKEQWTVNWGRPGVACDDPDYTTSIVLGRMAGNDHFYKYVYGEGVSYRSWINFWDNWGAGAWILENDVQRERFDEVLAMFDEDLKRYSEEGFPRDEFDDAITRIVNGHVLGAQSNSTLAWDLAVDEGNGLGVRHYLETPERIRAVKYEDVQRLAREVFDPDGILRLVQE